MSDGYDPKTNHGQVTVAVVGVGAVGAVVAAAVSSTGRAHLLLCGRRDPRPVVVVYLDGQKVTLGPVSTLAGAMPPGDGFVPDSISPDHAVPVDSSSCTRSGPVDWLFLAVKAHQSESAVPWLRRLAGPATTIVVLQNGVEQHERVARLVPGTRVAPVVVWCPADHGHDRHVRLRGRARLTMADGDAGRGVAALLGGSSMAVELTDDFVTAAWRKLILNAVTGLMAVTGRASALYRVPEVAELTRRYAEECAAVGCAEGAKLPQSVAGEVVASLLARSPDAGSSILTDRLAGQALEWDARNDVIRRRGLRNGIATPVSDVIVPLLRGVSGD